MRNQQNAAYRTVARDAQPRHHLEMLPSGFDDRYQANVGGSSGQPVCTDGWNLEGEIEYVPLRSALQTPHQGAGIQKADGADTKPSQAFSMPSGYRPNRLT